MEILQSIKALIVDLTMKTLCTISSFNKLDKQARSKKARNRSVYPKTKNNSAKQKSADYSLHKLMNFLIHLSFLLFLIIFVLVTK